MKTIQLSVLGLKKAEKGFLCRGLKVLEETINIVPKNTIAKKTYK